MKRKTFVKQLIALGFQRNAAKQGMQVRAVAGAENK